MYKKIEKLGFIVSIIFALSIFTSKALQNLSGSILLFLLFVLLVFDFKDKKVWKSIISKLEKDLTLALLLFLLISFIVYLINFDGKFSTARDMTRYLTFFPLVYFLDEDSKIKKFILALGISGTISIFASLIIFIKDFDKWNHTDGVMFYRISFAVDPLAYAGIISIFLLFLFSYLFFVRIQKTEELFIALLICTGIFILLVNRGKTAYISFIPALAYLCIIKSKKSVMVLIGICLVGFNFLPNQIKERAIYIVQYKKDPSSILRTYFWEGAFESIKMKPIFGYKDSDRQKFLEEYFNRTGKLDYIHKAFGVSLIETHNTYLQYWVQFGTIAFVYFILFLFIFIPKKILYIKVDNTRNFEFVYFLKHAVIASLISYYISGLTETTLLKQVTIYVFIILLLFINYINVYLKRNL